MKRQKKNVGRERHLVTALYWDVNLQDRAALGCRIDADLAEYANEYGVSKRTVSRVLAQVIETDARTSTHTDRPYDTTRP